MTSDKLVYSVLQVGKTFWEFSTVGKTIAQINEEFINEEKDNDALGNIINIVFSYNYWWKRKKCRQRRERKREDFRVTTNLKVLNRNWARCCVCVKGIGILRFGSTANIYNYKKTIRIVRLSIKKWFPY